MFCLAFRLPKTRFFLPKHKEENIPKLRKDLEEFVGAGSDDFVSEDGLQMPRNNKNEAGAVGHW